MSFECGFDEKVREQLQNALTEYTDLFSADLLTLVSSELKLICEKDKNSMNNYNNGSSRRLQIVLDYTWERLNTGHWKDVDVGWRVIYAIASLLKAKVLQQNNKYKEALLACDMGILMGAPLCDGLLPKYAGALHRQLLPSIKENHTCGASTSDESTACPCKKAKISVEINPGSLAIEEDLSLEMFMEKYLDSKTPVLIKGAAANWPAAQRWSVEHILKTAGHRTVPIEVGSRYTEESWSQQLMTVQEFVSKYVWQTSEVLGYLAQHRFLDQVIELRNDIVIPDYCFLGSGDSSEDDIEVNAWFGPGGTISPMHQDPRDNLLCQVFGSKHLILADVAESSYVYPFTEGMLTNTSQVDAENPNLVQFPLFSQLSPYECHLEAGDALYIPKKWWHFVKSLDPSFSVSFWFGD